MHRHSNRSLLCCALGAATMLLVATPRAQCSLTAQYFTASPLVDVCHPWDADGSGPGGAVLAFGGGLQLIPGKSALWIGAATLDPATGAWSQLPGLLYEVDAMTTAANGDLIAGGGGGLTGFGSGSVDRWNGSAWVNLGKSNGYVWSLITMPNGDLVAGGDFTQINGVAANRIARFDGTGWSAMGAGFDGRVLSMDLLQNGDLVAAGWYTATGGAMTNGGIARWNGTAWFSLPAAGTVAPQFITVIDVLDNGDIAGGGVFIDTSGGSPMTAATWDGSGWTILGTTPDGPAVSLTTLPGGDLLFGGQFQNAGGQPANNLARWDGSNWSPVGPGIGAGGTHQVIYLTTMPNGDVWAGGAFDTTPGGLGKSLARISTSCGASTATAGAGCTGSAGAVQTSVSQAAWLGGGAKATTSGAQAGWIALAIWGGSPINLPLSAVSPLGQSGCSLLVSPDFIAPIVASGASVDSEVAIPTNAALVGLVLHHQVALVETGSGGALSSLTSGNALAFTIGAF